MLHVLLLTEYDDRKRAFALGGSNTPMGQRTFNRVCDVSPLYGQQQSGLGEP